LHGIVDDIVAVKNAKLLEKVFFIAKKLLLHVDGISALQNVMQIDSKMFKQFKHKRIV
jgi:hypothetical protein